MSTLNAKWMSYVFAGVLMCLSAPGAHALDVGVAVCDITPDVSKYEVPMAGYGARSGKPSTGVHDRISAKVLVFSEGDTRMAFITTDLRSMTPEFKNQVLAKTRGLGLRRENLMVCASHNHSGPSLYAEQFWQLQFGAYDPRIVDHMTTAVADAVRRAVDNSAPAAVGMSSSNEPTFTRNRRWGYDEEARLDAGEVAALSERLWVMRVDSLDGSPRAILVNYATHPTILGADNFQISAEWPGALQRELEAIFPGAIVLYSNGAEGDQAPAGASGDDPFARVADFGRRLAQKAATMVRSTKTAADLQIAFAHSTPSLGEPVFSEASKKGPYAFMQPHALKALPRHAELQQFRIGNVVLAGLPGEPVAEVGRAVEASIRALGASEAVVIGLANDYIGYILNAKEYAHGGYEVDSRSFYGPGLGDRIAADSGSSAQALFVARADSSGSGVSRGQALFNGRNLDGWKLYLNDPDVDPATVWSVHDGVIHCGGSPVGYMRTTTSYSNYRLTLEWRWPNTGGNNGLLLHVQEPDGVWPKSIEAQMQHENAADFWVIGGAEFDEHTDKSTRRVVKRWAHNERPVGAWNHIEAVCEGDSIRVYVNGLLQNVATHSTLQKGFIALQSEGTPIEYRNIRIESLDR